MEALQFLEDLQREIEVRVAGIMSGTSLDGIDVAIVDIGTAIKTVAHATTAYSAAIRRRILAVSNAVCTTAEISRLNFELGRLYAGAVVATCKRSAISLESLELAGCHGQTIYHEGRGRTPNTLQIGEASVIAERLGIRSFPISVRATLPPGDRARRWFRSSIFCFSKPRKLIGWH